MMRNLSVKNSKATNDWINNKNWFAVLITIFIETMNKNNHFYNKI